MNVIRLEDIKGTSREVRCPSNGFISYRFLLKKDNMGFGLNKTFIPKGPPQHWHYKKHLEACFCISGKGILTDLKNRIIYEISPGSLYVLDRHDDHLFQAIEDCTVISIFNPPLKGPEVHGPDGSY